MDRKFLLVIVVLLISGILVFIGCSYPIPSMEKLAGKWESDHSETLLLNKDSTFIIKGLRPEIFSHTYKYKEKINDTGTWELVESKSGWEIFLNFDTYHVSTNFGARKRFIMYLGGSGILGNKLPWVISTWHDDPDSSFFDKVE